MLSKYLKIHNINILGMSTNVRFSTPLFNTNSRGPLIVTRHMHRVTRVLITAPSAHCVIPAKPNVLHYATYGGYLRSSAKRLDGVKKIDDHPKLVEVIEVDDHPYFPKGTCIVLGTFTKNPKDRISFIFYENHLLNGKFGNRQYFACPDMQTRILDMNVFRIDYELTDAIQNHPHAILMSKCFAELRNKRNIMWVRHKDTDINIYKSLLNTYKKIPCDADL